MNTIRVTKEFNFEASHALDGYDGKCKNIHGHSYQLVVTIKGKPIEDANNPKNGMVLDFGDLKQLIKDSILDVVTVQPIFENKETVIVKGLTDGTKLLAKPVPGAHKGMLVKLYNKNKTE